MLLSTVRNALQGIREDLLELKRSNRVVYDSEPLVSVIKRILVILERNGIPKVETKPIKKTEDATSDFFNEFSDEMVRIVLTVSRSLDELVESTNDVLEKFNEKYNELRPALDEMHQRLADIEQQTIEKVTNRSIYDHELKKMDFSRNVISNSLNVADGIVTLPIATQVKIEVNDQNLNILESDEAKVKLNREFSAIAKYNDAQVIQGTYLGNIIGRLDGSASFKSEAEFAMRSLYDTDKNNPLVLNYYTDNRDDVVTLSLQNMLRARQAGNNTPRNVNYINYISVDSNVEARAKYTNQGKSTTIDLQNGIWPIQIQAESITFTFTQDRAEKLDYQGLDAVDKNTDAIVTKYNYFTSLAHLFPDTINELNPKIETSEIDIPSNQYLRLTDRTGFYKYNMEVRSIGLFRNTYNLEGVWESGSITTDFPIESIDFRVEQFWPNDTIEYIKYEISFDRNEWYQLRPVNEGITEFNRQLKNRIVLSQDITKRRFLHVPLKNQTQFYIKVSMRGEDELTTPILYNMDVRVKVDKDAA